MRIVAVILCFTCLPILAIGIFDDFSGDQEVMNRSVRTMPAIWNAFTEASSFTANPSIDDALAIELKVIRPAPAWTFTMSGSTFPTVVSNSPMTGSISMSWQSRSNVHYGIQASGDLATWTNCWTTNGTGRRITNYWPPPELACFYRITTN
jgi:hypothetical protein